MDFSHSHNAPGKEWIGKQLASGLLKARKTNWNEVTLPGEVEAYALMLVGARAIGQDQARGLRPSRETINEWTSAMMLNTLTMLHYVSGLTDRGENPTCLPDLTLFKSR
ncbi:hypothetical protein [Burkholderia gladioli]|uniref:hypothetical protein n=2 Tax=Burkholderia gladioli TaxID=28095 RepID=UPI00164058D6|nr:hypothetical protein [Burkholderia gladioli]